MRITMRPSFRIAFLALSLALFSRVPAHSAEGGPDLPMNARVAEAYTDNDGNIIVRFAYDVPHPDPNQFYWAPHAGNTLYQLKDEGFRIGANHGYEIFFAAPTPGSPDELGQFMVEQNTILKVSSAHLPVWFSRMRPEREKALQHFIDNGSVTLQQLPDVRQLELLFRITTSEEFVVVTSSRMIPGTQFRVYIGNALQLDPIANSTVQLLSVGSAMILLGDGRRIVVPPLNDVHPPTLYSSPSDKVGVRLVHQEKSLETLKALGMNINKFQMPALNTPLSGPGRCRAAFADEP